MKNTTHGRMLEKSLLCLSFCLLLFGGKELAAQDFRQALLEMRKEYAQAEQLHIRMEVQVFEQKDASDPLYQQEVDIRKNGQHYLYKFGSNEMLLNDRFQLMVDKNTKEISWTKRTLQEEAALEGMMKFDLDSILSFYSVPEYVGGDADSDHYRIVQKEGLVGQIDLFLNKQTKMLSKMEYQYQGGQFISVQFKAFNTQAVFPEGTFDEASYIRREKGQIKGAGEYRGYNVLETETSI